MSSFITINPKQLATLVEKAPQFAKDEKAESALQELLEAEKIVSEALDRVRASFRDNLPLLGLSSIHGNKITVNVSPAGARFMIKDQQSIDPKFLELKLKTAAVEAFVEETGKLPEGVKEKERVLAVRIAIKKGAHD